MRFAGAALLLYLAWSLWRELGAAPAAGSPPPAPHSAWHGFLQGALMLLFSPGTYLFWALVLGPLLLQALSQSVLHAVAMLAGFYLFSLGGLNLLALALGRVGSLSRRARRTMQLASLVLMALFAAWLLYTGLQVG